MADGLITNNENYYAQDNREGLIAYVQSIRHKMVVQWTGQTVLTISCALGTTEMAKSIAQHLKGLRTYLYYCTGTLKIILIWSVVYC
jgi:hypothetical protein